MIELKNASKSYKIEGGLRKVILNNTNALLPSGRNVGILGINGSGKSTLIRLISGVEELDEGKIKRTGKVSFPLGFGGTFHPDLSGRENVRFLARIYGGNEHETIEYVERFSELGEYFRLPVRMYSSGMTARLAFGVCLGIDFDTYLIDEVMAVGDAKFRKKCLEAFESRMDHSDVIIVSHDENTIRNWCDMGAVLLNGRLEIFDDLEEAMAVHEECMMPALAGSF